ncbi:6026_t:CDS:2, partial [Racocetra persica]
TGSLWKGNSNSVLSIKTPIVKTKTKEPTTTIPLRKSTIVSLSKVNTASKNRTRTTVNKDTQPKFKSNTVSFEGKTPLVKTKTKGPTTTIPLRKSTIASLSK